METIILMIVHDEEQYINRAIDSVLTQEEIEVLLVDDASSDQTLMKAVAALKNAKLPFRVIHNPHNLGVAQSAKLAFSTISNRNCFLVRLDGDDELAPDAIKNLKTLYKEKKNNSSLNLFSTGSYVERKGISSKVIVPKTIYESLACGVLMYIPDIVKAGGLVNNEVGIFIEYDLYARLINSNVYPILLDKPVYYYNRQPNSVTSNKASIKESLKRLECHWGSQVVSLIRDY